ncbi:hypothetical protein, partial [Tessaracoccus sp. OH4464_COT-324]|uniref:hypothetical protein n=1 Tax=Tessaracoccus sp. OH4464_COT-324 TaxID=2491059 RepID=UPI001F4876C4
RAEAYRNEYNTQRPPAKRSPEHRPLEVHMGLADPNIPNLERETLPKVDTRQREKRLTTLNC